MMDDSDSDYTLEDSECEGSFLEILLIIKHTVWKFIEIDK